MRRVFITFGDFHYKKTRDFSAKMAKLLGGFDKVLVFGPSDIDEQFLNKHKNIFDIKRGCGLWLWKPYLILRTLEQLEDGDLLFYADAGSFFIRNVKYIERVMGKDCIWVSDIPLNEWQFTKSDLFYLMDAQEETYKYTAQIQASFICVKKCSSSLHFVRDWLGLCSEISLIHPDNLYIYTDSPAGFVAHREDQSILSLLCKKQGIKPHLNPSQYGKHPERYYGRFKRSNAVTEFEYPVCIIHHRSNLKLISILKALFIAAVPRSVLLLRKGESR